MTRRSRALGRSIAVAASAAALAAAIVASAQPRPVRPPVRPPIRPVVTAPAFDAGTGFRAHFGIDVATALVRSDDPEERLRGIERASALGGPEARVLLVQAISGSADGRPSAREPLLGIARRDSRALVAAARGLARELAEDVASGRASTAAVPDAGADGGRPDMAKPLSLVTALAELIPPIGSSEPELEALARAIALRALSRSGDARAIEALLGLVRRGEAGRDLRAIYNNSYDVAEAARNALRARAREVSVFDWLAPPLLSAPALTLAAETGDLRITDSALSATRAADPRLREAAISALTRLGAPGTAAAARELLKDADPGVRAAAGEALARAVAPDAGQVATVLLADETTRERAIGFAPSIPSIDVARTLAAIASGGAGDVAQRRRAVGALAHFDDDAVPSLLAKLVTDARLQGDAVAALGRSRAKSAGPTLAALTRSATPAVRRLAVRGLLYRALLHGAGRDEALSLSSALASSPDPRDRAVYIQTHVALGAVAVEHGLVERDASARAAAVMGALARGGERTCRAMTARRPAETDPSVRALLASAFVCPGGADDASSRDLWSRVRDGGSDAPLALYVLASRARDGDDGEVLAMLGAKDPTTRIHVAAGLAEAPRADATGRLARALLYEADGDVRRALVRALARRDAQATPSGREALSAIAEWDPEDDLRALAGAALRGEPLPTAPLAAEVAWLSLEAAGGTPNPAGVAASVTGQGGLAIPVLFDADGFALVPSLPHGVAKVTLAPRVPKLQP